MIIPINTIMMSMSYGIKSVSKKQKKEKAKKEQKKDTHFSVSPDRYYGSVQPGFLEGGRR